MRLVTVTPAGRRPYLEILANYLLRHRDLISEHRWWLNTRVPEDVAYIYRLTDRYPDFFRIVAKPVNAPDKVGYAIWQYMSECVEAETVYLRLDDDICYIADDAVRAMYEYRLKHPEPFLVLGNIVNNAICTHYHQQAGLVPKSWGLVAEECMDERGWRSGEFVRRLHRRFLKDLVNGRETHWKSATIPFAGAKRYSVNAICWRGEDFKDLPERFDPSIDEEPFMTAVLPGRLGRPNAVCSRALFGHYAFYPQRAYLERTSPEILARYRRLAELAAGDSYRLPFFEQTALSARRVWGVTGWAAQKSIAKAKDYLREGKQYLRRRAA